MCNRMSQDAVLAQYELQAKPEEWGQKQGLRAETCLIKDFPRGTQFVDRVMVERRLTVKDEDWVEAIMINRFGVEQRGVYVPILKLLKKVVRDTGGISGIVDFGERYNGNNERTYSCALDSDMAKAEQAGNSKKKVLFFSVYFDGKMLAKSGSGDPTVIRVRVDNVKGANTTWHDVGIPPTFIDPQGFGKRPSKAALREAKLEFFHRFLFMLLEGVSEVSVSNADHGTEFRPRLLGFVCDQPQERQFLCLMRGNCQQPCSTCCSQSTEKKRNASINTTEDGFVSVDRVDFETYVTRDVVGTVGTQINVAFLESEIRESNIKGIQPDSNNVTLQEMREYLTRQIALKFPSALSALPGIGTSPFRLYRLPGIDLLHAFDLGPGRQLFDDEFTVLLDKTYAGGRTKAALARVANQRIAGLSADTGCSKMEPFKVLEGDKQASYTGKQRRLLIPVAWYALMDLNASKTPDEYNLLHVALQLDYMQSAARGINRSAKDLPKTVHDNNEIQRKFAKACDDFMECFGILESTKLHRRRIHVADHLKLYGNFRLSDTGPNESLHKDLKASYPATNKRLSQIGSQLLQVNVAA